MSEQNTNVFVAIYVKVIEILIDLQGTLGKAGGNRVIIFNEREGKTTEMNDGKFRRDFPQQRDETVTDGGICSIGFVGELG